LLIFLERKKIKRNKKIIFSHLVNHMVNINFNSSDNFATWLRKYPAKFTVAKE